MRDVWRHRWIALALAWGVCLVMWPIVLVLPDEYEGGARVFVDPSTALKPVIQGLAIEQDVDAELNFVRQGLLSRPHLQKIVDETGLAAPPGSKPDAEAKVLDSLVGRIKIVAQPSGGAGPDAPPGPSKIYTITYRDSNRERSIRVVKILLDSFVEGTLGGGRSGSLAGQKFLEDQIKGLRGACLAAAEQSLADFKKHNVWGSCPATKSDYFTEAAELRNRLREENPDCARHRADASQWPTCATVARRRTARSRGAKPTIGGGANGLKGGDTLSRIQETQAKLDDLLLRFTEKYPDVIALRQTACGTCSSDVRRSWRRSSGAIREPLPPRVPARIRFTRAFSSPSTRRTWRSPVCAAS